MSRGSRVGHPRLDHVKCISCEKLLQGRVLLNTVGAKCQVCTTSDIELPDENVSSNTSSPRLPFNCTVHVARVVDLWSFAQKQHFLHGPRTMH